MRPGYSLNPSRPHSPAYNFNPSRPRTPGYSLNPSRPHARKSAIKAQEGRGLSNQFPKSAAPNAKVLRGALPPLSACIPASTYFVSASVLNALVSVSSASTSVLNTPYLAPLSQGPCPSAPCLNDRYTQPGIRHSRATIAQCVSRISVRFNFSENIGGGNGKHDTSRPLP